MQSVLGKIGEKVNQIFFPSTSLKHHPRPQQPQAMSSTHEQQAILNFINSYNNDTVVDSGSDLTNGNVLYALYCRGRNDMDSTSPTKVPPTPAAMFAEISAGLGNTEAITPSAVHTPNALIQLATGILVYLIQSEDGKEECVQNIMGLSEQDQEELMEIIQQNMTSAPSSPNSPFVSSPFSPLSNLGTPNSTTTSSNKRHHTQTTAERLQRRFSLGSYKSNNTPGSTTSSRSSQPDVSSRRLARENHILKEEVEWFTRELDKYKTAAATAEEKLRVQRVKHQSDQTRNDLQRAEEVEEAKNSFETNLKKKEQHIQTLQLQVEENEGAKAKLLKLKDELAIANESLKEKTKLEDTLNRYRDKHAQVGDLNAQVNALEEKTRTLLSRATQAEDKAATIPDLKQKLEHYKVAVAAAEVRVSELTVANKTKDSTIQHIKQQFNALREDNDLKQEERMDMAVQLSVANDNSNAFETDQHSSLSSFGGMTELNPEVFERVESLEKENAALREACDTSTASTIATLKNNLDDMSRIKMTFEKKYHDSSAENRHLSKTLAMAKQKCFVTQQQLKSTRSELTTTTNMFVTTKSNLMATTASLETLTLRFNDQHFNMTEQLLTLKEHSSVALEDLRSSFTEHLSKHTVSDAQFKEIISQLKDEGSQQLLSHTTETQALNTQLLLLQKSGKKLTILIAKGKKKLNEKTSLVEKGKTKMKQGAQLVKKLQKNLAQSNMERDTVLQKIKQTQHENALLRENGCSDMGSGNSKSSRSASKLNRELDRVIVENKKLQKEKDSMHKQLIEYQQQQLSNDEPSLIVSRAGRRSKRLGGTNLSKTSNNSNDTSNTVQLESENQRLRDQNNTLSMMKTVNTRDLHTAQQRESSLLAEQKKLEQTIISLRLRLERKPTGIDDEGVEEDHEDEENQGDEENENDESNGVVDATDAVGTLKAHNGDEAVGDKEEKNKKNDEQEEQEEKKESTRSKRRRRKKDHNEKENSKVNAVEMIEKQNGVRSAAQKIKRNKKKQNEEEAPNECPTQ